MKRLYLIVVVLTIAACNPKVNTTLTSSLPALDYQEEIIVLTLYEQPPSTATYLGVVEIGDSGFSTKCDLETVMAKAKTEARKAGGNVLKITEHKTPNAGSTCHRITANILKVADLSVVKQQAISEKAEEVDTTWNYAMLYVYRPKNFNGALVGYDLFLGDSLLCRVTNKSKHAIKIRQKGMNSVWAKTEAKEELPIDVEYGKTYYLRCGIKTGIMVGRPKMHWVENKIGRYEYELTKSKKR